MKTAGVLIDFPARDFVLGLLAKLSKAGYSRVHLKALYDILAELEKELSAEAIGGLRFTRTPFNIYSKRLDHILEGLAGYSIEVSGPEFQLIKVESDVADRHLRRLVGKFGSEQLDALLNVVVDVFVEKLRARYEH